MYRTPNILVSYPQCLLLKSSKFKLWQQTSVQDYIFIKLTMQTF